MNVRSNEGISSAHFRSPNSGIFTINEVSFKSEFIVGFDCRSCKYRFYLGLHRSSAPAPAGYPAIFHNPAIFGAGRMLLYIVGWIYFYTQVVTNSTENLNLVVGKLGIYTDLRLLCFAAFRFNYVTWQVDICNTFQSHNFRVQTTVVLALSVLSVLSVNKYQHRYLN
jgi:hypothetical protein